jgi:hypothetical protein
MRCKARRSLRILFSAQVDVRPRSQEPAVPTTTAGTIELGAARSTRRAQGELWSLVRTFASASEPHSPRGGSFVEGRRFPIFERPNSGYNGVTVLVPSAARSLTRARSTVPPPGELRDVPIFRVESAEVR